MAEYIEQLTSSERVIADQGQERTRAAGRMSCTTPGDTTRLDKIWELRHGNMPKIQRNKWESNSNSAENNINQFVRK